MNSKLSIAQQIPAKINCATASINRQALRHNTAIAQSIAPAAKLLAVIKANAYGHGLFEVANTLFDLVDGFAVARLEEAVALRCYLNSLPEQNSLAKQHNTQPKKTILVMSPVLGVATDSTTFDQCIEQQLTLVIHTQSATSINALPAELNYWLKLDSGMHRLGMSMEEIAQLGQSIPPQRAITLMTHYKSAEKDKPQSVEQQTYLFGQAAKQNRKPTAISIANSAALLRHGSNNAYQHWLNKQLAGIEVTEESIRPGIMLYGADPLETANQTSQNLVAAMTLSAPVISIRQLKAGESVGYNGNWTAEQDSVIATIGIGYGDGYPRHAANGTPVFIHGRRAKLSGTVSMDSISVDITELANDGITVEVGDTAELWGEQLSVNEVAKCANTISYQLFTGVTDRVKRNYI